jgi:hypothetical protein
MQRFVALLSALVLVVSAAGSSAASTTSAKNSFVGDFDVVDANTSVLVGHVTAQFTEPTERQVTPGTFQFTAANEYPIKAMRMAMADSLFWIDPNGGLPHAMAVGASCDIANPHEFTCHGDFAVMFRQWPGEPNSILYTTCRTGPTIEDWDFDTGKGCAVLLNVTKGDWVLKVAG